MVVPFPLAFSYFFAIVFLGFYQHTTAGSDHCVTPMGASTTGRSDRLDHSSILFPIVALNFCRGFSKMSMN
jgi:hypothetical protein